ncbi:MAG: alpha-amylase [Flavobacteriales bacterium]|nr:alpha-amylase [Flavobacteriales bacterium]
MKIYFLPAVAALLALVQCNKSAGDQADAVPGMSSPIRLQPDSTVIWLSEYVDPTSISRVILDAQELTPDSLGRVVVHGNIATPVSNLHLVVGQKVCDIPVFACEKIHHTFIYSGAAEAVNSVQIAGNMNGWNPSATPLEFRDGKWQTKLWLNPGVYEYQIVEDGVWKLDPNNEEKKDNGNGGFNSVFRVGSPSPTRPFISVSRINGDSVFIGTTSEITGLIPYIESYRTQAIATSEGFCVVLSDSATLPGRTHLRVFAHDESQRSNDLLIPLENGQVVTEATQLARQDMHRSVMYFMMVDRFFDGDTSNNRPTKDPSIHAKANNFGGDLAGIGIKINEGYFSNLGINTLWLSPISRNVEGAWGLWKDKTCADKESLQCFSSRFSAYHGYWPTAMRAVDNRFGTEAGFRELLGQAHSGGMNVLIDYVAHHVHETHPLYVQHPEWATTLHLPDGRLNTELWDEQRLTTWFDVFLPTWDFANPQVTAALSDTAMYWVDEFEIDGFRHDATKHIPVEFWRALTSKIKTSEEKNGRPIFQIGETYGNPELISSYLSSGQLDAQFDFNLYDAAVDAFAKENSGFQNLGRVLETSLHYYGHHHLMGNITGNQDRGRFTSYADGSLRFDEDAKWAGWMREINNNGASGFDRMQQLAAFIMTIPGIPCVYYGDEIGMPGGNDPDNRRMMQFDELDSLQTATRDCFARLARLRTSNMALLYGDTHLVLSDAHIMAYVRTYMDKTAIIVFYKGDGPMTVNVPLPAGTVIKGMKPLEGNRRWRCVDGMLDVEMTRSGYAIFTN